MRKSLKTLTSRSALQGNSAQCHYSRLQSSDLVSWSGNVTLYEEWLNTQVHSILFRFQVYEKVGISLVKGYEREGELAISKKG